MRSILTLFLFIGITSIAQNVRTQKDILQIPNTDLVKDFNLKTVGNIRPVTVTKTTYTDIGFGYEGENFSYLKKDFSRNTLTFDGNRLTENSNEFNNAFGKPNAFYFYYEYDANGILNKSRSQSRNAGKLDENEEINTYNFFDNGLIKSSTHQRSDVNENTVYTYNNKTLHHDFANGHKTYHLSNGLVTKEVTFNKSANQTYTENFTYNRDGFLIAQEGETRKYEFKLNDKTLIEKQITKNYTTHYKYVYDKFGNWIIAYTLSTTPQGLYGSRFNFYIRELKYSNGEETGGRTPESAEIKSQLLKVRQQLYDEAVLGKKQFKAKISIKVTNAN